MKKGGDKYIISQLIIPKKLPVDYDEISYCRMLIQRVRQYEKRGMSTDAAISAVNKERSSHAGNRKGVGGKKNTQRVIATVVVSLVALVSCASFGFLHYMSPSTVSAISDGTDIELTGIDSENILIVGSDERPEVDKGSGTSRDVPGIRTDIVALASIKDNHAEIVSFPRDMGVSYHNCTQYDYRKKKYSSSPLEDNANAKINSVYEQGGPSCLVDVVEHISNKKIDRYVQFNFDDFSSIIDSLGGVDVSVDQPVIDEVLGTIVPQAGETTLNGAKALDYVRARHVEGTGMSDFDRIKRQQEVVDSLLEKINSEGISNDPAQLLSLVSGVIPNLITDEIGVNDAIQIGHSFANVPRENIHFHTVPTLEYTDEFGNLILDEMESATLFEKVDDNLSGKNTVVDISGSYTSPSTNTLTGDGNE